jgi:hypothetical protein
MIVCSLIIPGGIEKRTVSGAVARHGECDCRALFSNPFYSGEKKGVWEGPFLKEGGKDSFRALLTYY